MNIFLLLSQIVKKRNSLKCKSIPIGDIVKNDVELKQGDIEKVVSIDVVK